MTSLILFPIWLVNAADDDDPEPILTSADSNSPDMSLSLYRALKEKLAALSPHPAGVEALPVSEASPIADFVETHRAELLAATRSTQALQRLAAAQALPFLEDRAAARQALAELLDRDSDPDVRITAARALGLLGDAAAFDTLYANTASDDENLRRACITSLGELRDDRAAPVLLQILKQDPKPRLRTQAALALGKIGRGFQAQDLSAALEEENDEHVRMAIAAVARAITPGASDARPEIPDPGEYAGKLKSLSTDMENVAGKLRDDRHDQTVQIEGRSIEQRLDEMVSNMEEMQRRQQAANQAKKKDDWRKKLNDVSKEMAEQRSGQKGPSDRGGPSNLDAAVNPKAVVGRSDAWASLPAKDRDELIQAFGADVPVRWRKRLEAYFFSIAGEENEGAARPVIDK